MGLAIVVHGGAGSIDPDRYDAAQSGCAEAAESGWRVLRSGGSALEAVQAAIIALENNPGFNAGTGAVLTADGRPELDAGVMEGRDLAVGAVAGVQRIHNPIVLARAVLTSPHVLLVGDGAETFATECGIAFCDPRDLITPAQYARWQRGYQDGDDVNIEPSESEDFTQPIHSDGDRHGTVGAVAMDASGLLVAGASTGGIGAKHPGRVGDTPLPGCGYYAENALGGVSCTGHGEDFIRLLLARRALDFVGLGLTAQQAASAAIGLLGERVGGHGGLIMIDRQGRIGAAHNTATMAHAYMTDGMSGPFAGITA